MARQPSRNILWGLLIFAHDAIKVTRVGSPNGLALRGGATGWRALDSPAYRQRPVGWVKPTGSQSNIPVGFTHPTSEFRMTTERKAAANQRNAKKSTGPKTAAGKNVVRRNALKHGLAAETLVVLGEAGEAFQVMADAHLADFQPRNSVELEFCTTFTLAAWRRRRCVATEAAMTNQYIRDSRRAEVIVERHEVLSLGDRLFFDSQELWQIYPDPSIKFCAMSRRRNSVPGGPDLPSRLVAELESTYEGCRWLLDQWYELRKRHQSVGSWQAIDIFKAIRLMGKQPLDILEDPAGELMDIFLRATRSTEKIKARLASCAARSPTTSIPWCSSGWNSWIPTLARLFDEYHAQSILDHLIDGHTRRMERLVKKRHVQARAEAAGRKRRLAFDPGEEADKVRRYEDAAIRRMSRACDDLIKLRRSGEFDTAPPADVPESEKCDHKAEETDPKSEQFDHNFEKINPKSENADGERSRLAVDSDRARVGQPFQADMRRESPGDDSDVGLESPAEGSDVMLESLTYGSDVVPERPTEHSDFSLESLTFGSGVERETGTDVKEGLLASHQSPVAGDPLKPAGPVSRSAAPGNGGLLQALLLVVGLCWLLASGQWAPLSGQPLRPLSAPSASEGSGNRPAGLARNKPIGKLCRSCNWSQRFLSVSKKPSHRSSSRTFHSPSTQPWWTTDTSGPLKVTSRNPGGLWPVRSRRRGAPGLRQSWLGIAWGRSAQTA